MLFEELLDFIDDRMEMHHIYQPVMLIALLENDGSASVTDIAKAILKHSAFQAEYCKRITKYENTVKDKPGEALISHKVVTPIDENKNEYSLIGYKNLADSEKKELVNRCKKEIKKFLEENRDGSFWQRRKKSTGCIFCEMPKERVIVENELAYAIYDKYPATPKHTLIIPKRHVSDYFSLRQQEKDATQHLLETQKKKISDSDKTVTAFNVGINAGEDAGQTIMHAHIHLIPRRKADVADPRGGVRGVISEKQKY